MEQLQSWLLQFVQSDGFILTGGMILLLTPLEWVFPAQRVPLKHQGFNLLFGYAVVLVSALLAPVIAVTTGALAQKLGFGLIDLEALGLPGLAGGIVAVLVSALIYDFFFYWLHRLEHANAFFWQEHAVHHSDPFMSASTGARGHFGDAFLVPLFILLPMALLFKLPPISFAPLALVPFAYFYVTHMNVRLGFGPLWWLLVSPDYHRIHHSLDKKHFNKNFVLWFPVWDILFGTAWRPAKDEVPASGLAGVDLDRLDRAFLFPFAAWWKMLTAPKAAGIVRLQDATVMRPARAKPPRRNRAR
jgi:sterol desaturase/sphingolipid hydroxylase (fatty acid hydroxylase superfamily)